ncbi:MAG: glycosyltransferase [Sulfurovum sp.]|nr:glycosyltransferase [Sulfurovum sp.]
MIEKNEAQIIKNWAYFEPPLLTVVSITYNHEKYISDALDGMLMQKTDFPFEIIVHDDCSTDSTATILKDYAKKYPTIIKLILQKENQYSKGIKPMTLAFDKALGNYLAISDGDDYWIDPNKLQIQLDEMRKVENCQMCFHSAIDIYEDNSRKNKITTKQANGNKLFTTSEIIKGGGGFCPTASLMFKKEVVENLPQWYKKAPFGDYFLQVFGSLKGGALYIDRPMSVYRKNTLGSWSRTMQDINMREKMFEKLMVSLDDMDNSLNKQFYSEIMKIKSDQYLDWSLVYLENNYFVKFDQTINKSYNLAEKKSKKLLLSFYLRKFPLLLQSIRKLILRMKAATAG